MRFALVGLVAAVAAVLVSAAATAPHAGDAKPLPGLPAYTAGFESWLRLNRLPIPPRRSDPHFGTKNVYVNQTRSRIAPAGRLRYPLPYGTVIVKSATRQNQGLHALVAVMRKIRGANPAHNDWVMVEYTRASRRARYAKVASGSVCTSCHVQAKRRDYVFTPLQRRSG
jgi:hypothetical protein